MKPDHVRNLLHQSLTELADARRHLDYSYQQVEELPALTVQQRQAVIRRALELEEPPLTAAEEALIESRLAGHRQNPASSLPLDEMKRGYAPNHEMARGGFWLTGQGVMLLLNPQ